MREGKGIRIRLVANGINWERTIDSVVAHSDRLYYRRNTIDVEYCNIKLAC